MPYKNLPESEWPKMDRCVSDAMSKQPDLEKPNAIAICYTSLTGKEYNADPSVEKVGNQYRVFDANSGATYKQVDSAREAVVLLDEYKAKMNTTTKTDYPWDQCIKDQMEEYGDEETAKKVCGSIRAKYGEYKALSDKERGDIESELKLKRKESLIDRVLTALKVGRRNSGTDEGRLQQIHDLSVENGAQCPMIYKQADGKLRWVLFSTNSFEDRDREIVSQKSLEADVDRMDQTKQYGPLRWWHVGLPNTVTKEAGPGFDIGDCDFVATHGHVRIDSGTFRNERIGEAIKEHADDFGASIGFFHPLDEPDSEGVYHSIYSFERSLLPRGKASNSLTALAVIDKESDMATLKDKLDDFAARFGNDPETVKQFMTMAEQIEQKAKERGLRQKETPPTTEVPAAPAEEPKKDELAKPEMKQMTPEECIAACQACIAACQKCVEACQGMADSMSGAMKERTEKEASIAAQITSLDAALKETRKIVDVLNSDLPKGVKKFIASQSDGTIVPDGKYKEMTSPLVNPLADIFNWVAQPVAVPAVQTSPEK